MSISDLLIDAAANHEMLSLVDGHVGYNQIFIAEADVHKIVFHCSGALGTYQRGVEVDKNKVHVIINAPPPTTKKQLQSLLGKINFLCRFIANSAGKMKCSLHS